MTADEELEGVRLYDALMAIKPASLPETEWAEAAGINRGFFGNLKTKSKNPRRDTLNKLLRHIGKSEADLKPAPPAPKPGGRIALVEPVKRPAAGHGPTAAEQPRVHTVDAGETVGILQLDLSLSMGPGHDIEDFVESDIIGFDASVLRGITRTPADRLRFVTGIGTSHEPRFQSGDQFMININERAITRIDGYYWITFEGGAHGLKRLRPVSGGRVLIMSDNKEDYPPYEVDAGEIRIEGRAIWFARGL